MKTDKVAPRRHLVVPVLLVVILGSACGSSKPPQIPNPASVYCVKQGGKVEMQTTSAGVVGWCVLPDGTRVDEWEYYRANGSP